MSQRNLFIIKKKDWNLPSGLEQISNELIKFALEKQIGINLNVRGYYDELLNLLGVQGEYFCLSDSFSCIETDELFDINNCFGLIENGLGQAQTMLMLEKKCLTNTVFLTILLRDYLG